MHRRSHLVLLTSIVAVSLLAGLAPVAPADGESWSARLLDLASSYGSEAWKYDLGYEGQAAPAVVAAHLQNQTTSYYGALGLRLTLEIQIYMPDDPDAQPTSSHNLSALIETTRGPLYALVKREGTSSTFQLDFDLDGANNAAPNGKTPPPVDPGLKTVKINIFRRVSDNTRPEPAGEAQIQFSYEVPYATATNPAFTGLLHQQPVPDNVFRLFTDVGWDRSVQYFYRPLDPAHSLQLAYEFSPGSAGQNVDLFGFIAERGVGQGSPTGPAPAPAPSPPVVPGVTDNQTLQSLIDNADRLVVVNKKLLATSRVEADGSVRFTVRGQDLQDVRSPAPAAALVAVAPVLVENFDPAACPGNCLGGAQYRVGATELVVPVSNQRMTVYGYELADPAVTGGQAPGPVRDIAIGVNSLRVRVRDDGPRQAGEVPTGDLHAVVPDARSTASLSGGRLSLTQPESERTMLVGDLPVRTIQAQHVSSYRVLALVYGPNDVFRGATFGDRGYVVHMSAPVAAVPPGLGGVYVNITSRTTNYDTLANDSLFQLRVYYTVRAPDLGVNETRSQLIGEGRTLSDYLPLTSSQAGSFPVTVESTSGDVLPLPNAVSAEFREPEPERGLVDRLPGPGFVLVIALVAVGAILARRR